ncbi:cation transporting ATPase C-terminal domain-containing protein, partial [Treponema sp. R6D11]
PRNATESLFANGEFARTIIYGVIISAMTILAYLYIPASYSHSWSFGVIKNMLETNPDIAAKARSFAFCTLAVSQLFHAFGMRNVRISIFKHKIFENGMMVAAFVFGLFLQIIVTEVPVLTEIFKTVRLSGGEWCVLMLWSMIPLLVHELYLPFNKKLK